MFNDLQYTNNLSIKNLPSKIWGDNPEVLMLDGIGDFFVLESNFSDFMRKSFSKIWWASRVQHFIRDIWQLLPNYPKINHHFLWYDWESVFCWNYKTEVSAFLSSRGIHAPWHRLPAFVWPLMYPIIRSHQHFWKSESSFLKYKIADISKFNLPNKFYVICPYSSYNKKFNNHLHGGQRDFSHIEWQAVINYLKKRVIKGIVLNIGADWIPDSPVLINLSNKTILSESIEIMKKAIGYIGIDSCMSVLAARLFHASNLYIKSTHGHCYNWKDVYFYPHKNFSFLRNELRTIM